MLFGIKHLIRSFHCTSVNNVSDLKAQSRMLKKLINRGVRKRNNYIKSSNSLYDDISPKGPINRKMAALNKIYFEHIVEIMQTGKCSNLLFKIGLEISKVEILENFKHLNIYWIGKNNVVYNDEIKEILKFASGEIQYEISSQRYIGKSPEIRFVRDTNFEKVLEVEKLFEIADFGKNDQFKKNDCEETQPKEEEMRQDVLGLNHLRIKKDILKKMKREKCIALPIKDAPRNEFDDSRKLVTFDRKIFEKLYNRSRIEYLKTMKNLKRLNYADEFSQKDDEVDSNSDFDDFDDFCEEEEDWEENDWDGDDVIETDDQYIDRDEHYEEINKESDKSKSSCVKNSESINTS